jgi:hypothetical protein
MNSAQAVPFGLVPTGLTIAAILNTEGTAFGYSHGSPIFTVFGYCAGSSPLPAGPSVSLVVSRASAPLFLQLVRPLRNSTPVRERPCPGRISMQDSLKTLPLTV